MVYKLSPQEIQIYQGLLREQSVIILAKNIKNNNTYRGSIVNIFRKLQSDQKQGLILHLEVLGQTKDKQYQTYYKQYFTTLVKKLQKISQEAKKHQKVNIQQQQKRVLLGIIQKLGKQQKSSQKSQQKKLIPILKERSIQQKISNRISSQQLANNSEKQFTQERISFKSFLSLQDIQIEQIKPLEKKKTQQQQKQSSKKESMSYYSLIILFLSLIIIYLLFVQAIYYIEVSITRFFVVCSIILIICVELYRLFQDLKRFFYKLFPKSEKEQNSLKNQ